MNGSFGHFLVQNVAGWRTLKGPNGSRPGPRPRLRSGGNLWQMYRQGLLDAYGQWANDADWHSYVVWAGARPHLVLTDPELVREVVLDHQRFERNAEPTEALFGNGLLRLDGEPWKVRRAALSAAFRATELARGVPIIREEFETLVDSWKRAPEQIVSPARDVSFVMFRVLGRLLFGVSFDREKHGGRALRRALITLSTGTVLRHVFPVWPVIALTAKQTKAARRTLDALVTEVLDGPHEKTAFRIALDEAMNRGDIDRQSAIDELRSFVAAGQDTSATALGWTLAMLATHPAIQERVRDEVLNAQSLDSMKALNALPYTTQVIREAMRLFPPVPVSSYRARRACSLGAWKIPAGTTIDICSYLMHRNPRLWPNPTVFDPDRFAPGRDVPQQSYFPFLFGPHSCIGMRLAMLELQLGTALIIRAFDVSAPDGPPRVNLRLSLHAERLRLHLRQL